MFDPYSKGNNTLFHLKGFPAVIHGYFKRGRGVFQRNATGSFKMGLTYCLSSCTGCFKKECIMIFIKDAPDSAKAVFQQALENINRLGIMETVFKKYGQ